MDTVATEPASKQRLRFYKQLTLKHNKKSNKANSDLLLVDHRKQKSIPVYRTTTCLISGGAEWPCFTLIC